MRPFIADKKKNKQFIFKASMNNNLWYETPEMAYIMVLNLKMLLKMFYILKSIIIFSALILSIYVAYSYSFN